MPYNNYQLKSGRDVLITKRDALKQELNGNHLSNTERLQTAQEIDDLNTQIRSK